ncbi:MAG: DnaJ domain-containing protein [Rhodospirillaceae bacterium]|nr:DnaJ domain-containing protein [Rhodospirillaceae bacterium]MDE0704289.1 DnaJ domain-containing protein [Rhodospirillaceae bacterium]MXW91696.1 DnaJ domain-containing protein [Rhodospirillaceae bacterium]MYB15333.1 DnaJ domain-containing protein [Rhodospirillaceae bacterium]MYI47941.1 DnaJ domain-containing protein [Rhodospirillaceae bacterium]
MRKVPLETFDDLGESLGLRKPAEGKICDHPTCAEAAEHRAPKSPAALNDYFWFCFHHAAEYNKAWNYYKGLSEEQIEREIQRDTLGRRPTWPLGMRVGSMAGRFAGVDDTLAEAAGRFGRNGRNGGNAAGIRHGAGTAEQRALETLQLNGAADMTDVKARYKALAKKYHPDANDGDAAAENRLKAINEAYTVLKNSLGAPRGR